MHNEICNAIENFKYLSDHLNQNTLERTYQY